MAVRRLSPDQPKSFAFTPENSAWAEATIAKYPPGKQASAIIPLLWRAQEQPNGLVGGPADGETPELRRRGDADISEHGAPRIAVMRAGVHEHAVHVEDDGARGPLGHRRR